MNEQLIFDTVVEKLLEQGERSIGNSTVCQYRGMDGRKCAIGHLIPDENYSDSLETLNLDATSLLGAIDKKYEVSSMAEGPFESEFLDGLREIHDDKDPDEWAQEFQEFAYGYNLNLPDSLKGA